MIRVFIIESNFLRNSFYTLSEGEDEFCAIADCNRIAILRVIILRNHTRAAKERNECTCEKCIERIHQTHHSLRTI